MRKTIFLFKGQKKTDSLILWRIISVLLQRLPVHRGVVKPPPHAQLPANRNFRKCPQHKLNLKQYGQKTKQTRQTRFRAISKDETRLFFHAGLLKYHKTCITGCLHTLCMSPGGARTTWALLWAPWLSSPSAALLSASDINPRLNPSHACPQKYNSLFLPSTFRPPLICFLTSYLLSRLHPRGCHCPPLLRQLINALPRRVHLGRPPVSNPLLLPLAFTWEGSVVLGSPLAAPCWQTHRFAAVCMNYSLGRGALCAPVCR